MQCQEFENRLNFVLDERGDPVAEPRLLAHAGECDGCRQLLTGQHALLTGLSQFSAPPLARGFARRVLGQVEIHKTVRVESRRRIWLAVGALLSSAAAALLTLSLVWYARKGEQNVAVSPQNKLPDAVVESKREPRHQAYPAGFAFGLIEGPRLSNHVQASIESLPQTVPQTIERFNQVERMAPGIRPIWRSFAMLWDALRQAWPSNREEEPAMPRRTSGWWGERLLLA